MRFGIALRVMGEASQPETFLRCAKAAEAAGLDELWVPDHIAISPDDTEGSGGRYLDPLAALAFLASATERIELGTGVLVLPYRPPLPTAKWLATIQELSGGRLNVGVGIGWMPMAGDPVMLAPPISELRDRFAAAGRGEPEVVAMGRLGFGDACEEIDRIRELEEVGVTRLMQGGRYGTADEFQRLIDGVVAIREKL